MIKKYVDKDDTYYWPAEETFQDSKTRAFPDRSSFFIFKYEDTPIYENIFQDSKSKKSSKFGFGTTKSTAAVDEENDPNYDVHYIKKHYIVEITVHKDREGLLFMKDDEFDIKKSSKITREDMLP